MRSPTIACSRLRGQHGDSVTLEQCSSAGPVNRLSATDSSAEAEALVCHVIFAAVHDQDGEGVGEGVVAKLHCPTLIHPHQIVAEPRDFGGAAALRFHFGRRQRSVAGAEHGSESAPLDEAGGGTASATGRCP